MTDKELGSSIRRWRIERAWSQQRLADELNLGASTISHIEAGSRHPSWDVMQRILALFGARLALVEGEEAESAPTQDEAAHIRAIRRLDESGRATIDALTDAWPALTQDQRRTLNVLLMTWTTPVSGVDYRARREAPAVQLVAEEPQKPRK